MAGELNLVYPGGVDAIFALIFGLNKTMFWNGVAIAAVSATADADFADGAIALAYLSTSTPTATPLANGDIPTELPAGDYVALFYVGTPTPGANPIGSQSFVWDGIKEITYALRPQLGATAYDNFAAAIAAMQIGTVDDTGLAPTTTVFESGIDTAAVNHWVGATIIFTSGTLAKQRAVVTAYSLHAGRGRFTVPAMTSAPASGDNFIIV